MPYRAGQALAAVKRKRNGDAALGRSNALLFCQLARFLVWAQQHQGIVAADSSLRELISETTSLLENAGTRVANPGT
jgi:hypothetical protein